MIIGFWDNRLSERGTTVALYNYAYYNQKLYNNKSIIFYNKTLVNDKDVINKFSNVFDIYGLNNFKEIDDIYVDKFKIDAMYIIKSGQIDNNISKKTKNLIHCVFNCSQPHGDVYACISKNVSNKYPVVPRMIDLPSHFENMRNELSIPDNAIVFGRHGGYEQFNIKYVQDIVKQVANENKNIYFLFLNTKKFSNNIPNIIYLDKIIDNFKKVKFINTCDAMLWARNDGESFGQSIGEFSIKNKPIFACKVGYLAHYDILKEKGIWYNKDNLKKLLINFDKNKYINEDMNCYKDYSPNIVMNLFKTVFLDKIN
jgi:hypothetical protein